MFLNGLARRCCFLGSALRQQVRWESRAHQGLKVTICGAGGNVGQPLALMLKQSPLIDELALYDIARVRSLGLELSHVDTKCRVQTYSEGKMLDKALENAKIVIILASSQSIASAEEMFELNAPIVSHLVKQCSIHCPRALIALATEPVNCLVPLASELLMKSGTYDANKVFGVTSIDTIRANSFVAELQGIEPESVVVPVICGHSKTTIVPVLSQAYPATNFTKETAESVTRAIRDANDEVASTKGAAPLSSAFGVARFVVSLAKGLQGRSEVVECTLVRSKLVPNLEYFVSPVQLGPEGVQRHLGMPKLSEYEAGLLKSSVLDMCSDVKKGVSFVNEGGKAAKN